jgi:hypothetical protein
VAARQHQLQVEVEATRWRTLTLLKDLNRSNCPVISNTANPINKTIKLNISISDKRNRTRKKVAMKTALLIRRGVAEAILGSTARTSGQVNRLIHSQISPTTRHLTLMTLDLHERMKHRLRMRSMNPVVEKETEVAAVAAAGEATTETETEMQTQVEVEVVVEEVEDEAIHSMMRMIVLVPPQTKQNLIFLI